MIGFGRVALVCAILVTPLRAQQAPPRPPERTVEAFLAALFAHRWEEAAGLLDPEGLQRIRRRYLNEPSAWGPPRPMTADDYQRGQPEMPRAVAEYLANRAAARPRQHEPYIHEFGLDSIGQLLRMEPRELAISWVKAHDGPQRMMESLLAMGCPIPPAMDSTFRARTVQVYGAVPAGKDQAFVLFRSARFGGLVTEEEFAPPPTVVKLRLTDAGWRLLPQEDLLNEFGGGFAMLSCPSRRP